MSHTRASPASTSPAAPAMATPVERLFLGWDAPALPLAAERLCRHYAGDAGVRMDGAVVVLPGARAGRRLKELLLEEAARLGLPLVPPRVTTVGALPELLYLPELPPAEPVAALLAWAEALRESPAERVERVFARRPSSDALREWLTLARELARLQRDVASVGLRFRDVAARCGEAELFDDGDRWAALGEVQADAELILRGAGLSDPDMARIAALEARAVAADRDVWLVGVTEMPEVVARMLRALERPVRCMVHAPGDRADAFDALGCVVPEAWLEAEIPLDEDRLSVEDRPEHCAEAVARELASLEGTYGAEDITVAVPQRELLPVLEQRLVGARVPVRDAAGEELSRTGPYRLLAAAADLLDGRRFDALAALARHADVADWLAGRGAAGGGAGETSAAESLDALDRYHTEHLPARLTGGLRGGDGNRSRAGTAALLEALDHRLLSGLTDERPLSEWAGAILELLAEVYGARDLEGDSADDRRLVQALTKLREAAASFRRLPAKLDERCSASVAIRAVLDDCAGLAIPPDPRRAAVELLGWLELHLDDAPVAVVTGLNEGSLPESLGAHAFLPNRLRGRLGLPDNDGRYARDAYQLTAILHSRERVRLVAGRRSAAGDPLRPSRLMLAADGDVLARRIRRFYEPGAGAGEAAAGAAGAGAGDGTERVAAVSTATRFQLPPERDLRLPEPVDHLRVTDFAALLQDPYRWALERGLGLRPLDDAAREMDPLLFGGLAHRVLERFGRSDERNVADATAIFARLEALLDHEFGTRFGRDAHVAAQVQAEQLRARLRAFAEWHAGWIAEGWQVIAVECDTPEYGAELVVDGAPFRLSARIDRIDYHAGRERWAVFDYKTGDRGEPPEKTHLTNRGRDWCDLQLPLYRTLLPSLLKENGDPIVRDAATADVRLGYILLPRDLEQTGAAFADWGADELAAAEEAARDVIRLVRANSFTYDESIRPKYREPRLEALLGRGQLGGEDEDVEEPES